MTVYCCTKGHEFGSLNGAAPKKCPHIDLPQERPCNGKVVTPEPAYEKCEGTGQPEVPTTDRRSKKPTCPVCGKRVEATLNHKVRSHKAKDKVDA